MKYKTIKTWPDGPTVGTIFQKRPAQSYFEAADYSWTFHKDKVESSPEFFAPYLFTDEVGNELYQGDNYYAVVLKDYPNGGCFKGDILSQDMMINYVIITKSIIDKNIKEGYWKMFSTKEAAQEWIEEQNNLKFEKCEWLYFDSGLSKTLFRFDIIVDNCYRSPEAYQVMNSGNVYYFTPKNDLWSVEQNVVKATPSQIEEILTKVAIHKGFREGVKYRTLVNDKWYQTIQPEYSFTYYDKRDQLSIELFKGSPISNVYHKGVWAEIIPQEETIPEYVECVSLYPPIGATKGKIYKSFYKPNSLNPYRWFTDGTPSGENGYSTLEMFNQVFKPSTKEAFDAQFKSDYLIYHTVENNTGTIDIGIDGKISNVSISDNNVKINYLK